jgi:hypothetical protein
MYKADQLKKYNFDFDNYQIDTMPSYENLSTLFNGFNAERKLEIEEEIRGLNHNLTQKVVDVLEYVIHEFQTKESEITLYGHAYKLSDNNRLFFWKNSKDKVLYITPWQLVYIYKQALTWIKYDLFVDGFIHKKMTQEQKDYLSDLEMRDKDEAVKFRSSFSIKLQKDSPQDILDICSYEIKLSIISSLDVKISKLHHSGQKQLAEDIVKLMQDSEEIEKMLKMEVKND